MKSLNLKFKITSPRKATVKATTLKNAINLNILIHNEPGQAVIDHTKLRNVVRGVTGNPVNGLTPNRFIALFRTAPKYTKINVTVLSRVSITKERLKEVAMDIIGEL